MLIRTRIVGVVFLAVVSLPALAVDLATELVADGFTKPVFACSPPGDAARLMVVQQGGKIRLIKNGSLKSTPFLDLSSVVNQGADERGLLGLAFHPNYASNGYFYVNYVDTGYPGNTKIRRFTVSSDPDVADADSGQTVLTIEQPDTNHNGGWLGFSPNDHYLYIAVGDGGGQNDPSGNGQNIYTKLGKILRLDVDSASPYTAPTSNPFYGVGEALIWNYGLRNPYRCSFDRVTGDLWMGDVGQSAREEIDFQAGDSAGGKNYGWNEAEGFACRGGGGSCGTNAGFTPPVIDYPRTKGQAVVGGYVYRGSAIPELRGTYFYADYIFGGIFSFTYNNGSVQDHIERSAQLNPPGSRVINNVSSFGEDANGELYILDYSDGEIYRIVGPGTTSPDSDNDGLTDDEEDALGTNPNDNDTDDDDLLDGAEVNTHNTNPKKYDTDDDGLSDGAEVNTHNTNPKKYDSDDDGLSDGAEVNTHNTNPKKYDSDDDGLSDGAEVNTHNTNPKKYDTDDDGLSDSAEVNTHNTNPKKYDTDDDGLSDGAEVNTHNTNPKKYDSDDDGLSDGAEVNTYGTDPLDDDSDNDMLNDGSEVNEYGTNPSSQDLIVLTKPVDSEVWKYGKKAKIRWNSAGAVGEKVRVELWRNGSFVTKIKKKTANDGKLNWRVKDTVPAGDGFNVYIRSNTIPAIDDIGDATFIVSDSKQGK